jgi:hypothetical protein
LIAIGSVRYDPGMASYRWPMLAVGFACIAAALGGVAVVRGKGWAAGGAAAVVLLFAWLLKPSPVLYLSGVVHNTAKFIEFEMRSRTPFLTGRRSRDSDFEFFAREQDIQGPVFAIIGQDPDLIQSISVGCISTDFLRKNLENPDGADITLVATPDGDWQVKSTKGGENLGGVFAFKNCDLSPEQEIKASFLRSKLPTTLQLISPAAAADIEPKEIFSKLGSYSLEEKTAAQDQIASIRDATDAKTIMEAWTPPSSAVIRYPNQWDATNKQQVTIALNLVVGWVQGIRENRRVAPLVANTLKKDQLTSVVELAGSPEKAVRLNATNFLSWMIQTTRWEGDDGLHADQKDLIESTVTDTLHRSNQFTQNSIYNLLVAIQYASCPKGDRPINEAIMNSVKEFTAQKYEGLDNSRDLARRIVTGEACRGWER